MEQTIIPYLHACAVSQFGSKTEQQNALRHIRVTQRSARVACDKGLDLPNSFVEACSSNEFDPNPLFIHKDHPLELYLTYLEYVRELCIYAIYGIGQ